MTKDINVHIKTIIESDPKAKLIQVQKFTPVVMVYTYCMIMYVYSLDCRGTIKFIK